MGNSQLEFSPTISLAKTSNTRRTPSFDFWVSIVDKVRSRPTWSELLRVAWDFDSPWIKGPMTPYQSRPYARHVTVIPAAKLCDSIAIVFLSIEVRILHNLRRYIDGSAILFWLSRDPYDPDDQRFHHASRRKLCWIWWVIGKLPVWNITPMEGALHAMGRASRAAVWNCRPTDS